MRNRAIRENFGVARGVRLRLDLRTGDDIELVDTVIFVRRCLGRCIALSLLRHDVNEDRALIEIADVLQDWQKLLEAVTVDRTDVIEPKLFEPSAALPEMTGVFFDAGGTTLPCLRQHLGELLRVVAQVDVSTARRHACEIS